MKVEKNNLENDLTITLKDENKSITICFGGNLDLYWIFQSSDVNIDNKFMITKENYEVFNLFNILFDDIKNINIHSTELPYSWDDEDYKEYYERIKEDNISYRKYNLSNYNELYHDDIITWYSDETYYEVANYVTIKKLDDTFLLEFNTQNNIKGYDRDFHTKRRIPIRFRNSGSRYDPFNKLFMKMYNNMFLIDDALDYGHQIHMEEYLYKIKVFK